VRRFEAFKNRIGIMIPFGSGNTPVDYGEDRRFDPHTQKQESPFHFLPLSGIPTTLAPNKPREASPTAKSYAGVATGYVGVSQVPAARTQVLYKPDNSRPYSAKLTVTGYVNPFESYMGVSSQPSKLAALGPSIKP
jgi:hypothetical protein